MRPAGILLGCLLIVALVGLADALTGQDLSLSIFYLIPAVVAATKGRRLGLLVAATAAALGLLADIAGRTTPYSSPVVPLWNTIVRLIVIVLVVSLVDALLSTARHERQIGRRDHLTGLQNSRAFYDHAETEIRGLARTGRPLTLAYIDVDHFKTVNDRLGHAAGDAVLVATSRTLAGAMRDIDTAARIGGDEFMVLLPETDPAQAQVALGRVHRHLSEAAVASGWDVGYSIGAVTFTSTPGSTGEMVAEADRVMYEVKQSEKGTIRFATF
jgi:diguanylate cyclase (GGDEF) domain